MPQGVVGLVAHRRLVGCYGHPEVVQPGEAFDWVVAGVVPSVDTEGEMLAHGLLEITHFVMRITSHPQRILYLLAL